MEILKEIFELIAYVVITGAGVVIVKKLLTLANTKIDEIQTNTKLSEYERLNKLIDNAQNIVTSIVESINQTFVDSLKASGNFNEEAQKKAKEDAIAKAKELLSEETIDAVEVLHGDINVYLDTVIERIVSELKKIKVS